MNTGSFRVEVQIAENRGCLSATGTSEGLGEKGSESFLALNVRSECC